MELNKNEESKTTTHYWGYRELSADELLKVRGGDDGDGGDGGCDAGGGCDTGDTGDAGDGGDYDTAGLGCNVVGGLVGVGVASISNSAVAGLLAGALATEACERVTDNRG